MLYHGEDSGVGQPPPHLTGYQPPGPLPCSGRRGPLTLPYAPRSGPWVVKGAPYPETVGDLVGNEFNLHLRKGARTDVRKSGRLKPRPYAGETSLGLSVFYEDNNFLQRSRVSRDGPWRRTVPTPRRRRRTGPRGSPGNPRGPPRADS